MKAAALSFVCAAVLLCACGRGPADASKQSGAGPTAQQRVQIDNFSLGTALGPHGGIAMGADTNMFEMGQLVYVAMELKQAPLGTEIHAAWKGPNGEVLGQETKRVMRGQRFINFAADSGNLPLGGNYQVEISVSGQMLKQLRFSMILGAG